MAKQKTQKTMPMEELYNILMLDIEPELTTQMLPELDAMYADETPEEHEERMNRYQDAFNTFAMRFSVVMKLWRDTMSRLKDSVFQGVKTSTTEKDQNKLAELEDLFSSDQ